VFRGGDGNSRGKGSPGGDIKIEADPYVCLAAKSVSKFLSRAGVGL